MLRRPKKCLVKAKVQEKVSQFFNRLSERTAEVQQYCRTIPEGRADTLTYERIPLFSQANHLDFTLALV